MSNFTYSQSPLKRSRTMSQMSSSTNDHMFNLLHAKPSRVYVTPKREVGGAGVQRGGTAGKRKKPKSLTVKWINNILFPITKYHIKNYGENFYGLTMSSTRLTRAGTLKRLGGKPMRQYWFEGYGLPLFWPIVGSTVALQGVVPSGCSLLDLAYFAMNNKNVDYLNSEVVSNNLSGAYNTSNINDTNIMRLLDKKICYLGGYQKHTFVNISNSHQFLELNELHPRDIMFDWEAVSNALKFRSVGDDLLKDYNKNDDNVSASVAGINNGIDLSPTPTRYNDVEDMMIRINSRSRLVHAKYKVSKPIKVALAPGETFHYTMRFDPFTFEEGELAKYIEAVYYNTDTSSSQVYNRPTSIPLFTKRLVVRAWGEVGHTALTINESTTLTDAQVTANQAQPTYLANTQANLAHLQEEQHAIRYMPEASKRRDVVIDERDQAALTEGATWVMEVMNEEIDGEEKVDV